MCGVIGLFGHPEAANLTYLGLHALQHRGQESAGIVSTDGEQLRWIREMGNVNELRARLEDEGAIFQTTSDTEVILHLVARSKGSLPVRVADALKAVRGA